MVALIVGYPHQSHRAGRKLLRRLPKWFYVVLAAACYVGIHQLAGILQGASGAEGIAYAAAYWMQYIVPGLLLIAALFLGKGDVERRPSRTKVSAGQTSAPSRAAQRDSIVKVDPFRRMSEGDFHTLITEFFVRNGFGVDEVPAGMGDGVDMMLRKGGKQFIAQYRHWRELRVSVPMVREQYTVMQVARASGVYVITTGEFTYKAIQYAEDKNIVLIDGAKLRRLLNKAADLEMQKREGERAPLCPLCAAEMLVRTGADASGTEKQFWSCSNYPQCSGSLDFTKSD